MLTDVLKSLKLACKPRQIKKPSLKITHKLKNMVTFMYESKVVIRDNHNYNKIVKSDWLSTTLISALIGQLNRTVRVMPK